MERLGVDIDETIVDFLQGFLEWRNSYSKEKFKLNDFKSYNWWQTLDITKAQAYKEASEYIEQINVAYKSNIIYGSLNIQFDERAEKVLELLARRYEFHGITDRSRELERDTFEISSALYSDDLEERIGEGIVIPFDRIHFTRDYNNKRSKTKAQICKELGITKIIDDNPEVARECSSAGIKIYMPNKPWNENYHSSEKVFKGNWYEIGKEIINT